MQATGPVPRSYQMHSKSRNRLPLELLEVVFRDALRRDSVREVLADRFADALLPPTDVDSDGLRPE